MTCDLFALCFDANDPPRGTSTSASSRRRSMWCSPTRRALGWPLVWDQDQETAIRSPHGGPKITWGGPPLTPKTGKYRLHFDLAPPVHGDQQVEVDRLVSLGATRIGRGEVDVDWTVLTDPDDNEFCVIPRSV